jgi:methyl-accepting chemotaxis protein
LKAAYGLDFALFVEEKPLREFARGLNPATLSDQNRVGRFIRFHTTDGALIKALAVDADLSTVMEPTRYIRDALGLPYGASGYLPS